MGAGQLDDFIYIESPTNTKDFGVPKKSWSDLSGTSPATPFFSDVLTAKGSEAIQSSRLQNEQTIRVKIRYRDDVKTSWRVKWQDQYYYIQHIDRSARRDGYLWFTAVSENFK